MTGSLPGTNNEIEAIVKLVESMLMLNCCTVTSFKYLGSLFTSDGASEADVNNMIIGIG